MKRVLFVPMVALFFVVSSEAWKQTASLVAPDLASSVQSPDGSLPEIEVTFPTREDVIEYDHTDPAANVLTVRVRVSREGGRADHENLCAVKELLVTVVPTGERGGNLIANTGALFRPSGPCPTSKDYEFTWDYNGKPPGHYDILAHAEASQPLGGEGGHETTIELIGVNGGTRIRLVDPVAPAEPEGERVLAVGSHLRAT